LENTEVAFSVIPQFIITFLHTKIDFSAIFKFFPSSKIRLQYGALFKVEPWNTKRRFYILFKNAGKNCIRILFYCFLDPPTVTVPEREYVVEVGNEITLECGVEANPPESTAYWRKLVNGEWIDVDTSVSRYSPVSPFSPSLTITNVDTSDEGMYKCFADNEVGTGASQQTSLRVTCK
jgi:hypothetical protein